MRTFIQYIDYLVLVGGCFIISMSFSLFLMPYHIASGGIPGLSVILHALLNINAAYIQWGINIPLFFIGLWLGGSGFGIKTALGSVLIPLFIIAAQYIPTPVSSAISAAILGGIGTGIGLCLIFKSKGSVGGFSLVAQLLHQYTGIRLSSLIVVLNMTVVIASGLLFGYTGLAYSLGSLLITGFSIDTANLIFDGKLMHTVRAHREYYRKYFRFVI